MIAAAAVSATCLCCPSGLDKSIIFIRWTIIFQSNLMGINSGARVGRVAHGVQGDGLPGNASGFVGFEQAWWWELKDSDSAILLLIYLLRWSGRGRREERDCSPVPRPLPQSRRQKKPFFFFRSQPPQSSTVTWLWLTETDNIIFARSRGSNDNINLEELVRLPSSHRINFSVCLFVHLFVCPSVWNMKTRRIFT